MSKVQNVEAEVEVDEIETEEVEEVTFSAKDLAAACGTDPKSFRRWLRSQTEERANKGGRWVFSEARFNELLEAFRARDEAKEPEASVPDAD